MTYRARAKTRTERHKAEDKNLRAMNTLGFRRWRRFRGDHTNWETLARLVENGAAPEFTTHFFPRRRARKWTPTGEKAMANRRRDADIRQSVAFLEQGGYGMPWWMLSQGYEAPALLVVIPSETWKRHATREQLAAEKAYLESLP